MAYTAEQYIKAFWRKIGAKDRMGYTAVKTVLLELIAHGKADRSYMEQCAFASKETGISVDYIKEMFSVYRAMLLTNTNDLIIKDIFLVRDIRSIKADQYDTLCYSAGYIKRIMCQQHYTDDTNPRYNAAAFTGPRPEKLPPGIDMEQLRRSLMNTVNMAVDAGLTVFYSGMSRGIDIIAANVIIEIKEREPSISLIGAIPFEGQEDKWNVEDKREYERIKSCADSIVCVSDKTGTQAYFRRNEFMVDRSARVISVYDKRSGGGTGFTVAYAQKMGVEVVNIDPNAFISTS